MRSCPILLVAACLFSSAAPAQTTTKVIFLGAGPVTNWPADVAILSYLESRYGKGSVVKKRGKAVAMEWNSRKYHVRAIDKLEFYGSFCLTVADPTREKTLVALRESVKVEKKRSGIIDSMIEKDDGSEDPSLDENASAINKATGKN